MAPSSKPPAGQLPPELGATVFEDQSSAKQDKASGGSFRTGECFAGRYEILERLGAGAMGEVYRARDQQVGDTIALKRIATVHNTARAIERFRQEVRLARRIAHSNVARIYDLGEYEETLFLSMEYICGVDLERVLAEQGRLPADEIVRIGIEIANGLDAAHRVGVIHRDLKPANIMREEGGRIIITDFGIAASNEEGEELATGEVMGSPAFMAPEQVEGGAPDLRSDLFSLGIILYQLASGSYPFSGRTPLEMAMARLDTSPKPLPEDLQLPAALVQVIMHCLERDPDDRPASAADLRRELLPLAGTGPLDHASELAIENQAPSATMLRDEPTIRVRCFQYRGPEDTSYLGEGVAEELIDTLSRTRGLRVIAGASTGDEASTNQDGPLALIVNGRVERQGNRFRIVVRLINARTETQLWTDVFSAEFADLFAAQEQIAQRVAEALRLEFDTAARHDRIPQESVELYLRARQQARLDKYLGDDGAIALLEQSLVLAPGLRPAMAWRALAMARSFWDSRVASELTLAEVEEQVTFALQHAGTQAESHLAAASLAGQAAQYAQSVKHLKDTLEVAPTCGTAHYYLGEMQCNTGRLVEGEERLRLATQLDPSLRYAEFPLLRQEAFRGNWAPVEKALAAHQAGSSHVDGTTLSTFLRMAMWAHRDEWLSPITRWAKIAGGQHYYEFFNNAVSYLRSPTDPESFDAAVRHMAEEMESIRFRSLLYQLLAEAHAYTGEEDLALLALEEAVGRYAFSDIDWMERSPSTLHFRTDARFLRLAEIVRERAESIWTVI